MVVIIHVLMPLLWFHALYTQVALYQSGETKLLGFLVGQVMRKIARNGDPKEVKIILIDEINKL